MIRAANGLAPLAIAMLVIGCALAASVQAATITSRTSGDWSSSSTWNGGVPQADDDVVIASGHTVTLDIDSAPIGTLTVNAGATLTGEALNPRVLSVGKGGGTDLTNNGTIDFAGEFLGSFSLGTIRLNRNSQWAGTGTWDLFSVDLGGKALGFALGATATIALAGGTPLANVGSMTAPPTVTLRFDGNSGLFGVSSQTLPTAGITYGAVELTGSATKRPAAGTFTVSGPFTLSAGTTWNADTNDPNVLFRGNVTNNGNLIAGSGTYTFGGTTAQTLGGSALAGTTVNHLVVDNSAGLTISHDTTVTGVVTLSRGVVTTSGLGTELVASASCTGSVVRGSGWVAGSLRKTIPTGSPTCSFEVGDANGYRPVTGVAFRSVTSSFTITASVSQSSGKHPDLLSSLLSLGRGVNRYWTMTNNGLAGLFATYDAVFNFLPGDLDPGTSTDNLEVGKLSLALWERPTVGVRTPTSVQILGVGSFSDFAIAEPSASQGTMLYLGATGVPSSAFASAAPTGSLANHDPGRDSFAGLLVQKGGSGAGENDAAKHQRWLSASNASSFSLSGTVQLRLWSAMKDFNTAKRGAVTAFLRECNNGGNNCTQIASASLNLAPWSTSSGWVERTLSFGNLNHTVAANRRLELKIVVNDASEDDMWFAYASAAQPSALVTASSAAVNHYQVSVPANSLACQAATVTVTACADASSPCTNPATTVAGATATLGTTAGTLGSTALTFDGAGVATTTLSHPAAAEGAAATLTLSGESVAASAARRCCPDGASCAASNTCSTNFRTAGLLVATVSGGGAATIPAQTAGTTSASYVLRAVRTNTTTKACEAALTGSTTVSWSYTCHDPTTCSGGNRMTLTGAGAVAIAGNPNGGGAASTAVTMNFDADGNAPFTFRYADVGRVSLAATKAAGGALLAPLAGTSNAFVVRPAGFTVSGVQCTSYAAGACATGTIASPGNNPGATSAAGPAFMPAGAAFRATVTAVDASGNATPNFGRESSPEGVALAAALVQPAGGVAGTLAGGSIAGSGFGAGAATVTNLSYGEVGIITLTPSLADGNYLGAGAVTGTTSGPIGRFVPARFALSAPSVTHRPALGCSPASAFTYLGENFRLGFTLTAQNTAGATTQNYAGAFARLDPTSAAAWNLAGRDGGTVFTAANGRLALGSSSGSWSAGSAAVLLQAQAVRGGTPEGPFSAAFGIAPLDADGVALAGHDLSVTAPFGTPDRSTLGTLALRFGRLVVGNAIGAADRPLALPVTAQSWTGSAFAVNTLDGCTTVPAAAVSRGNLRRTLTASDGAVLGPVALAAGQGALRLAAPGGGRSGTLDVALSLGSAAADASCLAPWTPAAAATAGAQLGFLRGAWCGSGWGVDPAARASFGLRTGSESLIHRRENF